MKVSGAMTAIQSQWTYRSKSGLIVALSAIDTPTMTVAHKRDTGHPMRNVSCLPTFSAIPCRATLGLVAVVRNDAKAAHEQYEVLKSARVAEWYGSMSPDRLLGLSSHTMGVLDQAVTHFEDGITFCGKAGYRPELAWTYCDCAETLLQRNGPSDSEKAALLLKESLAISTGLGMRPLIERARSFQLAIESQPAKASAFPEHRLTYYMAAGNRFYRNERRSRLRL